MLLLLCVDFNISAISIQSLIRSPIPHPTTPPPIPPSYSLPQDTKEKGKGRKNGFRIDNETKKTLVGGGCAKWSRGLGPSDSKFLSLFFFFFFFFFWMVVSPSFLSLSVHAFVFNFTSLFCLLSGDRTQGRNKVGGRAYFQQRLPLFPSSTFFFFAKLYIHNKRVFWTIFWINNGWFCLSNAFKKGDVTKEQRSNVQANLFCFLL